MKQHTNMRRRFIALAIVLAMLLTLPGALALTAGDRPADYETHLAFMFGNDRNQFMPRQNATRADVAAILARITLLEFEKGIEELPEGMSAFTAFSDVDEDDWFYYYVAWAYDAELVRGDDLGQFRPRDPITRQEFAAMLARTLDEYEEEAGQMSFRDAGTITPWARHYVYTVYSMGWMVGDNMRNFNPLAPTARADTATAMNRILGRIDYQGLLDVIINLEDAREFADVSPTAWYFASVVAAANDHRLTRDADDNIDWKEIIVPEEVPPPCDECDEYPCICDPPPPPCDECDEYPCICDPPPSPCDECDEYPCVCDPEEPEGRRNAIVVDDSGVRFNGTEVWHNPDNATSFLYATYLMPGNRGAAFEAVWDDADEEWVHTRVEIPEWLEIIIIVPNCADYEEIAGTVHADTRINRNIPTFAHADDPEINLMRLPCRVRVVITVEPS